MSEAFDSSDHLWRFTVETAARLREAGLATAGGQVEDAARHVTGSGWEWLGIVARAADEVLEGQSVPASVEARLRRIRDVASSNRPYATAR